MVRCMLRESSLTKVNTDLKFQDSDGFQDSVDLLITSLGNHRNRCHYFMPFLQDLNK